MADETVPVRTPTLEFGEAGISNPTPKWAKAIIWTAAFITFGIALWVGGTDLLTDHAKKEWLLLTVVIDKLIFFICKSFGIEAPSVG